VRDTFVRMVKNVPTKVILYFEKQLKKDFKQFGSPTINASTFLSKRLDAKRMFWRNISLNLMALRHIYCLSSKYPFEIANEPVNKDIISAAFGHKIKLSLGVSYELRLKLYMQKKAQHDVFHNNASLFNDTKGDVCLAELVGSQEMICLGTMNQGLEIFTHNTFSRFKDMAPWKNGETNVLPCQLSCLRSIDDQKPYEPNWIHLMDCDPTEKFHADQINEFYVYLFSTLVPCFYSNCFEETILTCDILLDLTSTTGTPKLTLLHFKSLSLIKQDEESFSQGLKEIFETIGLFPEFFVKDIFQGF